MRMWLPISVTRRKDYSLGLSKRLWYLFGPRRRQLLRLAAKSTSLSVTTILGLLAIAIPLLSFILHFLTVEKPLIALLAALSTAGFVLSASLAVTYFSLRTIAADEYAETLLRGEPATSIIVILAIEIHRLCRHFLLATERPSKILSQLATHLESLNQDTPTHKKKEIIADVRACLLRNKKSLESQMVYLNDWHLSRTADFRRLSEVKKLASQLLGIPHERLCDHLVQFSPSILELRVSKFVANCAEISEYATEIDPSQNYVPVRLAALVKQNLWIIEKARSRITKQTELVDFSDLLPYLNLLASEPSTGQALQIYLRALGKVPDGHQEHNDKRARFLHRKQQAHPGFDLHELCISLCKSSEWKDKDSTLTLLKELSKRDGNPKQFELLRSFREYARGRIYRNRVMLCRSFRELRDCWLLESGVVVTIEYSKVIREIFKRELESEEVLKIVLGEQVHSLGSRILMDEIRENDALRNSRAVALADVDALPKFLTNGQHVLILVGAEVCDSDSRLLLASGVSAPLERLVGNLQTARMPHLVVVAAEGYKLIDSRLIENTQFFASHLHDLDSPSPDLVDAILTEEGYRFTRNGVGTVSDLVDLGKSRGSTATNPSRSAH